MAVYILAPAYNEARAIVPLLNRIERCGGIDGVVIVDDGSSDATAERVEGWTGCVSHRVLRHPRNLGLGAAMRTALEWAVSTLGPDDVVVTMDADNTHDPALVRDLCEVVARGKDVAIASRFCRASRERGLSWTRRALTRGASLLLRSLRPIPGVRDYSSGFRAYRASILMQAHSVYGPGQLVTTTGFDCMAEILLRLAAIGARCGEVPLDLRYDLKVGTSKMRVGRTVGQYLSLLRRVPRYTPGRGPHPLAVTDPATGGGRRG